MRVPRRPMMGFCAAVGVMVALATVARPPVTAQGGVLTGSDLDRARQRIEGSFELAEWKADGQVLRPPQVEGRFSLHNGIVLFMIMRKDLPVPETSVGYGAYRFDGQGYSYGYSYLETLRADEKGVLTRRVSPPSTIPLALHWQGDVLHAVGRGSDRREYTVAGFNSPLGDKGDYRRWRRVP